MMSINIFVRKFCIITVLLVFYYFQLLMVNPDLSYWQGHTFMHFIWELIFSFLIFGFIFECSLFIGNTLNRVLTWKSRPFRRLVLQIFVQGIFILIFISLLNILFSITNQAYQHSNTKDTTAFFLRFIVISINISLLIAAIQTGMFLLKNWRRSGIEATRLELKAARLDKIAVQSELQALKLQLDPHFIFNNFSTLSELIDYDQETAQLFLKNLSKIYRYLLQNSVKDLINLEDEIEFISSYVYLMKIRHGKAIHFNVEISPAILSTVLPPLTLQLLIENAIAHNQVSEENPLIISIKNNISAITVTNNISPLTKSRPTSGTGIKNIVRRYRLLSKHEPTFFHDKIYFKVSLPILKNENYEDFNY